MDEEEIVFEPEEEFETYSPDYSSHTIDPNENSKESMQETMASNKIKSQAEALKNNIKAYKNANKNDLKNSNLDNSTSGVNPSSTKTLNKGKNNRLMRNTTNPISEAKEKMDDPEVKKELLKTAGTAAASSVGISPEVASKVLDSKIADKALDKLTKNKSVDKENDTDELENFSSESDVKKSFLAVGLIFGGLFLVFIVMLAVVTVAAEEFIDSVTFGFADDQISEKVDDWIEKNYDDAGEKIEEELGFNNLELNPNNVALATIDSPILIYNKFNVLALKLFKKVSKSNPASEEDLESFFGNDIFNVSEEDKDIVMLFYSKLYNINTYYKKNYNVSLDMPLLMSTLYVQSDDKIEIFKSNAKKYNPKKDEKYFDCAYDWSGHKLKKDNAEHDIEILAQAMVSNENGRYKIDEDKYFEFLKQFIEVKYYLEDKTLDDISENTSTGNVGVKSIDISGFEAYTDNSGHKFIEFKQCSSQYRDHPFPGRGKAGATLCQNGCGPNSISIVATGFGDNVTPPTLDLTRRYWVYDGIQSYFYEHGYDVIAKSQMGDSEILKLLRSGYKFIVNVVYGGQCAGYQSEWSGHWYTIIDVDGSKVYVSDPAKGGGWVKLSDLTLRGSYVAVKK